MSVEETLIEQEQRLRFERRASRCQCRTPVGTQCMGDATQEDRLCDGCRRERGDDHWCGASSTPPPTVEKGCS